MNQKIIQFLASLFVIVCLSACGSKNDEHAMLWQACDQDSCVWLMGSVHVGNETLYPLNETVMKAFEASSSLAVEININDVDPQQAFEWVQKMRYPEGKTVFDDLDKVSQQRLKKAFERYGLPKDVFASMKPAILAISLTEIASSHIGYTSDQGIDQFFLKQADAESKPVLELETLDQQMSMIQSMPEQDVFLQETLKSLEEDEVYLEDLVSTWKSGDESELKRLVIDSLLEESESAEQFLEALLFERNIGMTNKIISYLKQNQSVFVVAGAAHFVGDRSIIDYLKQADIQIKSFTQ